MKLLLPMAAAALLAIAQDAPTASIAGGFVQGAPLGERGAVFKGIPFAQAPAGPLRWQPPRPLRAWTGALAATRYGAPCAQMAGGKMQEGSSEDCLYLNVWTPQWPAESKLPVMVWFHGGGNYAGTASSDGSDGASLARHGVIVVTANYRLSVFGFFAHPELTRESPSKASGNYGLMDQIAALQWVKANIAGFGGDPANVTIFGQSAGAVDVNVLMTSPMAAGLFHRVIAESGTVTRNPDALTLGLVPLGNLMPVREGPLGISDAATLAEAERAGAALAALWKAPARDALQYLRALPAADLLAPTTGPRMSIGPANGVIVDGLVLPKAPAEVFAAGKHAAVPLLLGNNVRERSPEAPAEQMHAAMRAMYGPLADKAIELYNAPDPVYGSAATQWAVDTLYRCPVVAQLVWHVNAGGAAYEYEFVRGPAHGAEVAYVFGRLNANATDADKTLSAAMQIYWTNFAKAGDPNGGGAPAWPKFDNASRGYMSFLESGPAAGEGLRRAYCELYVQNVQRLAK